MVKRAEVGLIYQYNEAWIGGTYYVINLVHALKTLQADQQPLVSIITDTEKEFHQIGDQTNYPFLSYINTNVTYSGWERIINKASNKILGKNIIEKAQTVPSVIFPTMGLDLFPSAKRRIFWIPDFQEKYLPHFFSKEEIAARAEFQHKLAYSNNHVVFSSCNAKDSFNYFYPNATAKQFVVPFAVSHPDFSHLNEQELLQKFQLPQVFYFSPNQFWAHKNHIIILKALKIVKEAGLDICVAFSGKEHDYRNPNYFKDLQSFVKDNGLENNVRFLGFIDRLEQLKLMSMSLAIIQPSKFEGWSSVIEDAKAQNKFILASNIPVHKEQIADNVDFFDIEDEHKLAEKMISFYSKKPVIQAFDYGVAIKKFGKSFLEVVQAG